MKTALYTVTLGLLVLTACGKQSEPTKNRSITAPAVLSNACSAHAVGESFPSEDGCNTCSCRSNGSMACTMMACGTGSNSLIMQAGIR